MYAAAITRRDGTKRRDAAGKTRKKEQRDWGRLSVGGDSVRRPPRDRGVREDVIMRPEKICQTCGGKIPADAPEGLCPRCLARLAGFEEGRTPRARTHRRMPARRIDPPSAFDEPP